MMLDSTEFYQYYRYLLYIRQYDWIWASGNEVFLAALTTKRNDWLPPSQCSHFSAFLLKNQDQKNGRSAKHVMKWVVKSQEWKKQNRTSDWTPRIATHSQERVDGERTVEVRFWRFALCFEVISKFRAVYSHRLARGLHARIPASFLWPSGAQTASHSQRTYVR